MQMFVKLTCVFLAIDEETNRWFQVLHFLDVESRVLTPDRRQNRLTTTPEQCFHFSFATEAIWRQTVVTCVSNYRPLWYQSRKFKGIRNKWDIMVSTGLMFTKSNWIINLKNQSNFYENRMFLLQVYFPRETFNATHGKTNKCLTLVIDNNNNALEIWKHYTLMPPVGHSTKWTPLCVKARIMEYENMNSNEGFSAKLQYVIFWSYLKL